MAPGGGGKRKRGDRSFSGDARDENSRPSPHRPGNLALGQQMNQPQYQQPQGYGRDNYDYHRGGPRRRASRGGRGGGSQRSPLNSPNAIPVPSRPTSSSSKPMSPTMPQISATTSSKESPAPPPSISAVSAAPQIPEQEPSKPEPYDYEYITDERLARWADNGRSEVVADGEKAQEAEDALMLGVLFQEVIRSGIDARLESKDAGCLVREIVGGADEIEPSADAMIGGTSLDSSSLFLDNLSIATETFKATPALVNLVHTTGISPAKMRRELDSTLLESLGLIRSTFVRVGIRQQTNLLYRQSNYNLLREETEGYSKLVTEFFTTSNNEPPTSDVVEDTFERVKGMIGAFDLDVGRVLDITLDVFAAVLVKQYRFFVKYLRASSWWPQNTLPKNTAIQQLLGPLPRWALPGSSGRGISDQEKCDMNIARTKRDEAFWQRCRDIGLAAFFELGGRQVEESALKAAVASAATSLEVSAYEEDRNWIEITRTLPPPGNKVAAQVLGFKLRFYCSSARDPVDVLPVNLIYLAALLIKVGFISLRDLYPHIWPEDTAMNEVREEKSKEKTEREKLSRLGGGATNALLAAAPLPDDTNDGLSRDTLRLREAEATRRTATKNEPATSRSTPVPPTEDKIDGLPEPAEQKVQLLKSLLCIGALPEALYMLGHFPWLPDAFPDLPEYIHRILHHCLSKVYEPLRPLEAQHSLREQQKIPDPDAAKGTLRFVDAPVRKTLRWAQLDKDDASEAIDYRFYWDDWADALPICQNVDDVFTLCSTLLNYSGVKIGQDPSLLLKISRVGSFSLATDTSTSNTARWIDLAKRLLVPALSLTKCNPGVVNEVFELIKNFPTDVRYNLYAEWYSGQTSRLPDIKSAFEQTRAETKDVLKRISKTTIKPMARALAKAAYASPGVVFQVAISQLESYDNLVETVVECARYLTFLAYDVLTWSLMSALGGRGRNRLQADGILTSKWLHSLSVFAGKVFKRYSIMSPTPIIQYVAEQLRQGNSIDLIILEEIVKSMAGILSNRDLNETQLIAMAGAELLQAQTLLSIQDKRHESKTTARRLMRSLMDSRLAGQVLVSLAQERQTCVFRVEEQDAHPKLLGNLFDQLHRIFAQYLDLLRSNLSIKDFNDLVPNISRLIIEFGVDPSIAFCICRQSIKAAMAEYDSRYGKRKSDASKQPAKDTNEDNRIEEASVSDANQIENSQDNIAIQEDSMDLSNESAKEVDCNVDNTGTLATNDDAAARPENLIQSKSEFGSDVVHPVLKEIVDVVCPALPEEIFNLFSPSFFVTFWQSSISDVFIPLSTYTEETTRLRSKKTVLEKEKAKNDKEIRASVELFSRLQEESNDAFQKYRQTRTRLQKESKHWFSAFRGKYEALNVALIERCFFPRLVISPSDALYAFKMLKFLHTASTPNFKTMGFYDQLFSEKRLTSMIFLLSAKEGECLGRFLNEVLRDLGQWHADKAVFEKEAHGTKRTLSGFAKRFTPEEKIFYEYEDFRRILYKWHRNLSIALKACMASGEYMHIRNAINIFNHVHQSFPSVNWMGKSALSSIEELSASETREDLKVAATSLIGALRKREKEWLLPQAFNLTEGNATNGNGTQPISVKPSTPGPGEGVSKPLNPSATEFQPKPQLNSNIISKSLKNAMGKPDAEDGEIEDVQMADASIKGRGDNFASESDKAIAQDSGKESATPVTHVTSLKESSATERRASPAPLLRSETPKDTSNQLKAPLQPTNSEGESSTSTASSRVPIPARPNVDRGNAALSTTARPQHNLPNRPEAPTPRIDSRMSTRQSERAPNEYARDSRLPERSNFDGARDSQRGRGSERPVSGSHFQARDRTNERNFGGDAKLPDARWPGENAPPPRSGLDGRLNGPPLRETRPPPRDDRAMSRLPPDQSQARQDLNAGPPLARDAGMHPPRSTIPQHPDRAAMIQSNQDTDRVPNHPPSRGYDTGRPSSHPSSERSSRAPSPVRNEERGNPHDGRYATDERPTRHEDYHTPTGPRTERSGPVSSNDRFRDSMKPSTAMPPSYDMNHGRLRSEPNHGPRQSDSYGRLNAVNDVPSGPRLPNGNHQPPARNGRIASGQQPPLSSQHPPQSPQSSLSSPPSQDRSAPHRPPFQESPRSQLQTTQPHSSPNSVAPSAQGPEVAGIHPDRLKAIQGTGPGAPSSPTYGRGEPTRGPQQAPPPVSIPPAPRGPHNTVPSPIGTSPTTRNGPPTGPAYQNDTRGRGSKQFNNIQNVLQQSMAPPVVERSGQGASIRGRGGRANNAPMPSPSLSGPPTPVLSQQDQFSGRNDLLPNKAPGGPAFNGDDSGYNHGPRRGPPRDGPREPDRRNGRHRSRSPNQDRHADSRMQNREDERPIGREEPRDRFGGPPKSQGGIGERDMRSGAPPERELRGPPPGRSSRDETSRRDRGGEPERRGSQDWNGDRKGGPPDRRNERDRRDEGGSLRKRGRLGDEGFGGGERYMDSKRPRRG